MSQANLRELEAKAREYIQGCYPALYPILPLQGKGTYLKDVTGKEYLDCFSGISVTNVGHCHPKVVKAICDQASKLAHVLWNNVPMILLAEKLAQIAPKPLKKSYFCNSGNEAVEGAVKLSKKYSHKHGRVGSHVLTLDHGFHGRGGVTLTLTGEASYKHGMGGFADYPGVVYAPAPYCYRCPAKYPQCNIACAQKLEDLIVHHLSPENVAAFIVEPIEGEGGIIVPPDEYLPLTQKICRENGVLFVVDEVQTGFGRTGKLFASEHYSLSPDIMTLAKALGSGMPISAVMCSDDINTAWEAGDHTTTFSSNPICCAAALAGIEVIIEEKLPEKAASTGRYILEGLMEMEKRHNAMGEVRGKGMMIGVELVKDRATKAPAREEASMIKSKMLERGIIIGTGGIRKNVLRIQPPLMLTADQADQLLENLESVFKELG
jgi:4-aminobutyrate aminotransferase